MEMHQIFLLLFVIIRLNEFELLLNMFYFSNIPLMVSFDILRSDPRNVSDITKKKKLRKKQRNILWPVKNFENISWLINICLKYFMTPAKTHCPSRTYAMCCPLCVTKIQNVIIGH